MAENNIEQLEFDNQAFLKVLPEEIAIRVEEIGNFEALIEVVLDLGRKPEARFTDRTVYLRDAPVSKNEIESVVARVGSFDRDNRAGIEKTLHRISGIFNRKGEVVGLTCRVGRAIYGTIDSIRDIIEGDKSVLLLGKPGVGKTTLLREAARVLSDEMGKRVIVVDTSNEIGGDGDIPHPGIGSSRRMQVPFGRAQEDVMIEAVENHFPEVIIIDEIGRVEEAKACRTIAERGVRLIATAHGISIENLMVNPTLQDLIGGIDPVTLSDEEAIRRGTQKTILERESPPTFDVLIEIKERGVYAIYHDVSETVDALLRGFPVNAEVRTSGTMPNSKREALSETSEVTEKFKVFTIGINSSYLERAINSTRADVEVVKDLGRADLILADKRAIKKKEEFFDFANHLSIKVDVLDKPSLNEIKSYLKRIKGKRFTKVTIDYEKLEDLVRRVIQTGDSVELPPETEDVIEEERNFVARFGLSSETVGLNPNRRLIIHPRKPK
jgi:stage III sporulation protein SpoIIIAA